MEHTARSGLEYLTVQDVLWINLRLMKTARAFRYAPLEEAANAQYAYGASADVVRQAAAFVVAFSRLKPFDAGNQATGFAATLAFLLLNGKTVTLPDSEAAPWYEKICSGAVQPEKGVEIAVADRTEGHGPNSVEDAVAAIVRTYPETLRKLVGSADPVPA